MCRPVGLYFNKIGVRSKLAKQVSIWMHQGIRFKFVPTAVPLAPLFARSVYKAMMGQQGWDEVYPSQEALQADLQCFRDTLVTSTVGNWWKREAILLVAGDASEFVYAAYTPEGELGAPIVVSLSAEELQLMEDNEFSSTLREILCILKTTQIILQRCLIN